jgi:outer membrane immunogenic protein
MKKVLLGGVALITLGFVGTAVAADMPLKAPPAPVAVNTWTGYYFGGYAGGIYGANQSDYFSQGPGLGTGGATTYDPVSFGNGNHWGVTGGIYAGYNWAVTPSWVIGVEGDWGKTNLGNSHADAALTSGGVPVGTPAPCATGGGGSAPPCNGVMTSDNVSWIATVRGRLGYTWGSSMLYGTAGGAFINEELSGQVTPAGCTVVGAGTPACPAVGSPNTNITGRTSSIATSSNTNGAGWVAGGGLEFLATANWLVRVEYLHYAFGTGITHSAACSQCITGAFSGPGNFTWGSASFDSVRAGLAYKF